MKMTLKSFAVGKKGQRTAKQKLYSVNVNRFCTIISVFTRAELEALYFHGKIRLMCTIPNFCSTE